MNHDLSTGGKSKSSFPKINMVQESKQTEQTFSEPEHVLESSAEFNASRVIVFPVDASPNSKEAVKWALKTLINKDTDQVLLLNVRPSVDSAVGFHQIPLKVFQFQLNN
jgi:hypothetical protein